MCHSFETYDPKIAIREVEARLRAPAPDLSFVGRRLAAAAGPLAALARPFVEFARREAVE